MMEVSVAAALTVTSMHALPGAGHAKAQIMATRKESGRKLVTMNLEMRAHTFFQSTALKLVQRPLAAPPLPPPLSLGCSLIGSQV